MASKRPISTQRIPTEKKAAEKAPERAAAVDDGPASGVAISDAGAISAGATITDTGDKSSKEQTAAEATTPRHDQGTSLGRPDELPEARTGAKVSDGLEGQDTETGLTGFGDTRPSEAELEERLFDTGLGGGDPDEDAPDPGTTRFGSKESMLADGTTGGAAGGWGARTNADGEVTNVTTGDATENPFFDSGFYEEVMTKKAAEVQAEKEAKEAAEGGGGTTGGGTTGGGTAGGGGSGGTTGGGTTTGAGPNIVKTEQVGDGTITTFDDGSKVGVNADGSMTTVHPDGRVTSRPATPEGKAAAEQAKAQGAEGEAESEPSEEEAAAEQEEAQKAEGSTGQPVDPEDAPPTEEQIKEAQKIDAQLGRTRGDPDTGNASQPVEDDAAFGTGVGTPTGPATSKADQIKPVDPVDPDLATGSGGGGGTNPNSGFTDPGPDAADDVQSSGPERDLFPQNREPLEPPASDTDDTDDNDDTGTSPFARTVVGRPVDRVPDELDDALLD